jgi:hypothetical protein
MRFPLAVTIPWTVINLGRDFAWRSARDHRQAHRIVVIICANIIDVIAFTPVYACTRDI